MLSVKIHEAYRKVVAVCDEELLGKRFEEGNKQLEVKKDFYEGDLKNQEEVINILKEAKVDDATINIVGKDSIDAAIKANLIDKGGISQIQGIPHALSLL